MSEPRPERSRAVTLSEVASAAGVSIGTASKALNDRFDVSATTRERVLSVASELGFTPNALARSMRAGVSHTIGILTNDLQGRFVPQIMHGAEVAIGRERSTVLLSNSDGDEVRQQHQLQALLERRVDGIIVVDEWMETRPPISGAGATPVVYVFGMSSDPADTSVVPDVRLGGRLAARHLIDLGRRAIAHVGGERSAYSANERAAGFIDAMRDAGLPHGEDLVFRGLYSEAWGWDAVSRIIGGSTPIDGLFAGNDQIARGAIDRLQAAGLRVPEDVAVVGYDDWQVLSVFGRTPITSIDMRLDVLGAEAVEQLYGDERRPGKLLVSPRLVARTSTVGSRAGGS